MTGESIAPTDMALSVINTVADTIPCAHIHKNSRQSQIKDDIGEPSN